MFSNRLLRWFCCGFLRPDPPPPIIVGGFGPKMAELAGRVGDGINVPALHPHLGELVAIARDAYVGAGRDPNRFLVTVYSAFDETWFDDDSPSEVTHDQPQAAAPTQRRGRRK